MVAAGNAQHAPQHGGGHGQPPANQHHYDHGQAHRCLLFALLRASARSSLSDADSLAAASFQAIDQRSTAFNSFALSNALN
jgi:hypothetical protein